MPAIRTKIAADPLKNLAMGYSAASKDRALPDTGIIVYPTRAHEREMYRTEDGKKVTPYQWKVYDFIKTIPKGRVMTYKTVCESIGGSPRSVGGALRNNPFMPYIPCHRIIATDLFIGGSLANGVPMVGRGSRFLVNWLFSMKKG
ncbi:hypothetical protein BDZ89DRAFT_1107995, partial [Hymenopellis radicata]